MRIPGDAAVGGVRLSILYSFRDGPYGGANQFLKALRAALQRQGSSAGDAAEADAVLFNSHHDVAGVLDARRSNPGAVFIHRVDGPMRLYNDPSDPRDALVARANRLFADATVFQSEWSKRANEDLGFRPAGPVAVIGNAADASIFTRERSRPPLSGPKVRLIAIGWSVNPNKGFDVYEYLDAHLDFHRFEMVLVGNTPLAFRNVRHVPPCPSAELARHLKESDIFVSASRFESCPNSLIEALACGLPAITRGQSSQPEVLNGAGELFYEADEVPALVERVVADYHAYVARIRVPSIEEIASRYRAFAEELLAERAAGRLRPKKLGWLEGLRLSIG